MKAVDSVGQGSWSHAIPCTISIVNFVLHLIRLRGGWVHACIYFCPNSGLDYHLSSAKSSIMLPPLTVSHRNYYPLSPAIIVQPSLSVPHRDYCAFNPLYMSALSPKFKINTASHQMSRLWRANGRQQTVENPDTRLLSDYARQVTLSTCILRVTAG